MMDTSSVPLMMDVEGGEDNIDNKARVEDDFAYHNNVAGASKHVRLGEDKQQAFLLGLFDRVISLQVS